MSELELLQLIHNDLSCIVSFIVFFVIVVLCYFTYKFFNIFFNI